MNNLSVFCVTRLKNGLNSSDRRALNWKQNLHMIHFSSEMVCLISGLINHNLLLNYLYYFYTLHDRFDSSM